MMEFDKRIVLLIPYVLVTIVALFYIVRKLVKSRRLFKRDRLLLKHTQSLSDFSDDLKRRVEREIGSNTYLGFIFAVDRAVVLLCSISRENAGWFGEDGVYSEGFLHHLKNLLGSMHAKRAVDGRIGEIEEKFARVVAEYEARVRRIKK